MTRETPNFSWKRTLTIMGIPIVAAYGLNEIQKSDDYNSLYDEAVACVEHDNSPGLTKLSEIYDFYMRAGLDFETKGSGLITLPSLSAEQLERIVESCEPEIEAQETSTRIS